MMTAPTVVLVHGAFAGPKVWDPVSRELTWRGFNVRVPSLATRSLSADATYIRSFVEQIDGPVVLAGHSYGGAVITVAGDADNVVGLVYVAGHALSRGESIRELHGEFPDSHVSGSVIRSLRTASSGESCVELSIRVGAYSELFAPGLDRTIVDPLAEAQQPLAASAVDEPATGSAWKSKPAWGIVAAADRVINPDVERFGYARAGLRRTVEIDAPHLVMLTHPREVSQVIVDALHDIHRPDGFTDAIRLSAAGGGTA